MPLTEKLKAFIKDKKWQEADKVADALLMLMKGNPPTENKSEGSPLSERLPAKIQKIQKELPAWIQANVDQKNNVAAFMQELDKHLKAKDFAEAEKTADAILKLMGMSTPTAGQSVPEVKQGTF